MFKLYSKGCQYALRALTFVVAEGDDVRFQAKEICERAEIPESFTRKVFQSLVQGGFLNAHRGPGGGYSLKRPAGEITLLEVIKAVEGEDTFDHCVLGFSECGSAQPCPLHEMWVASKKSLLEHLSNTTIDQMTALSLKRKMRAESRIDRTKSKKRP